ncbi:immunity protein [Pseudomonas sp. MF6747]|uniref:immunity protein n=1 Tax=Pseudomonas sp. MF6747 TaxID=2797527 RepID=UPI00190B29C1|nr:immunity protein [Pseudomonas sp. MF6747]MBK3505618.1 immunity protein [Pseudomonas sp. MF6747]
MSSIEHVIQTESVEDVLLAFAPNTPYPSIDRLYVQFNFDVISTGQLLPTYKRLLAEGKLAKDANGHTLKGPNWKEPTFITEKKYSFE